MSECQHFETIFGKSLRSKYDASNIILYDEQIEIDAINLNVNSTLNIAGKVSRTKKYKQGIREIHEEAK